MDLWNPYPGVKVGERDLFGVNRIAGLSERVGR